VAHEGEQVRITVRLIHGPTDQYLWGESYERELHGVLALKSEVARAIAEQIQVTLTPEEAGRLATAGVVDPAAYEDYLKGLYHWNKLNPEGWEAAAGYFQQSSERDSALAEAHASLAHVQTSFGWDWAAADRASLEALRLNPNSTMVLFSRALFLSWVGRHEEAIAVAKRAVELDPVAPHVNTWLGMHYFMARRYDEAIGQLNKVLALEPEYRDAHIWLSYSYAKKGLYEEAGSESQIMEGSWLEAFILALAGRPAEARKLAEQIPDERSETPNGNFFLAVVLGELGERDRAFALLEQAYHGRSALMSVMKVDPRIDSLRDDPRFEALLRRLDFPN
jgi:tetratricopeptide (TPR) repeat protein